MDISVGTQAAEGEQDLWKRVQLPLLVAACYYLAAETAFFIGTLSDSIFAPFWPPNIVLFCALLTAPMQYWWRYLLAVFPAHAFAEIGVGMGAIQLVVAFATNSAVAATNAYAAQRFIGGPPWLNSLRKATLYVLITALISPASWAFVGAFVPIAGGGSISSYWTFWGQWYAANAMASMALGPIAIVLFCEGRRLRELFPKKHVIEFAFVNACLVVACTIAFKVGVARATSGLGPTILYLPLPLILWSAARFGGKGVAVAVLIATIVSIWRGLEGPSPFVTGDPESSVFALQTFLIGLSAPLILLGAAVDEARHAERVTREAEERMAFAAASASIGLWQFSGGGNDFWATDYCRSMFGFDAAYRPTWSDVLMRAHPEDRDIVNRAIEEAKQSAVAATCEFRTDVRGATRWLTMSARVERDDSEKTIRISGFFSDITSRKNVEAEVELQRRELAHLMRVSVMGELSGALAHELNQPLTAILANAEAARRLLTKRTPAIDEVIEALDDIVKDDNRAGEVIHRLHRLLKKGDHKSEPVDLNELLASSLRLVHSQLISKKIRVQINFGGELPLPNGDAVQMQQVFLNVIMNAIEAMSTTSVARRVLRIETRCAGDQVEVEIADQGPGMTAEQQARVFEPFYSTKDHGLGLGLAICATIVRSHAGQIRVNDNGGGATVVISLPIETPAKLAEAV